MQIKKGRRQVIGHHHAFDHQIGNGVLFLAKDVLPALVQLDMLQMPLVHALVERLYQAIKYDEKGVTYQRTRAHASHFD
jgi:hypothetical protein